jgi:DNA repair protein RadC
MLCFWDKSVKYQMRSCEHEIGRIFYTKRNNTLLKHTNVIPGTLKHIKIG